MIKLQESEERAMFQEMKLLFQPEELLRLKKTKSAVFLDAIVTRMTVKMMKRMI